MRSEPLSAWLDALEQRHLAEFTFPEVARALRALSSCYVERRSQLAGGGALATRGKRAAFALFYGPLHFFVTRRVIRALGEEPLRIRQVIDAGCGTGAAGAAWAVEADAARVSGRDRNAWAVGEANWTYRTLGLQGRAVQGDVARTALKVSARAGVLLAYVANELDDEARASVRDKLMTAAARGAHVLVIEPISRRVAPWWSDWQERFLARGGCADEWRFSSDLPQRQRDLARAAGLDPQDLTARSLWL